jgi:fumarylacetoacetase
MRSFIKLLFIFIFIMEGNSNKDSWVNYDKDTQFPIQNIPFGVCHFKKQNTTKCCSRIGNSVIDLHFLENKGILNSEHFKHSQDKTVFDKLTLNTFIDCGRPAWKAVRESLISLFKKDSQHQKEAEGSLHDISEVEMRLPVEIGDYTDFYSSRNHAFNIGSIIRGPEMHFSLTGYIYQLATMEDLRLLLLMVLR